MNGIGFFFVRLWAYCMSICPFWLLYLKSDFYFFMVYHLAHYRRKVVRNNLLRSFPQKTLKEIKAIEKQFYRNLCDQVVEMFKLPRMSVDEVTRRIAVTNPEGTEHITLAQKGVIPSNGIHRIYRKVKY